MAKVKFPVQVEEDVKEYIEQQAERLGVSQSGFVNLCIAHYREQREAIQGMNQVKDLVYKLEKLQRAEKEKK